MLKKKQILSLLRVFPYIPDCDDDDKAEDDDDDAEDDSVLEDPQALSLLSLGGPEAGRGVLAARHQHRAVLLQGHHGQGQGGGGGLPTDTCS